MEIIREGFRQNFWEKRRWIPLYVYDFEEDIKGLNILNIFDNTLHGSVKLKYWDGEYHRKTVKTIECAIEYLSNIQFNFVEIEIKTNPKKDRLPIKTITATLNITAKNILWRSLKHLRPETRENINIRRSIKNYEIIKNDTQGLDVNRRPTYLDIRFEFDENMGKEEATNIVFNIIKYNSTKAMNHRTCIYGGSIKQEFLGMDDDRVCQYYKLASMLNSSFAYAYEILGGGKSLFKEKLLNGNFQKEVWISNDGKNCLMKINEDLDLINREYKDCFIEITDELKINDDPRIDRIEDYYDKNELAFLT